MDPRDRTPYSSSVLCQEPGPLGIPEILIPFPKRFPIQAAALDLRRSSHRSAYSVLQSMARWLGSQPLRVQGWSCEWGLRRGAVGLCRESRLYGAYVGVEGASFKVFSTVRSSRIQALGCCLEASATLQR